MLKVSVSSIGILSILLYFVMLYLSDILPFGQIFGIIPLLVLGLLLVMRNGLRLKKRLAPYLVYMYLFAFFCALSTLWAENPRLSAGKVNAVVFIAIGMTVVYLYSYQVISVDTILSIIMYGGYITVFIISLFYGWSGILSILNDRGRLTNEFINSNTLGMCTAYALVINIYYILYGRRRLTDVLIIPAVIIIAVSGSRKALLIMLGGALALFLIKNLENKNVIRRLLKLVLILLVVFIVIFLMNRLSIFSKTMGRLYQIVEFFEGNATRATNSAWIRFAYIRLGLQLFKEHPFLGIGIGNANIYTMLYYGNSHYLHNNYVEMLACGGIVGFLLHYWIYFYLFYFFIKNFKYRDKEFNICFVIFILKLVMDYGAVSYYSKPSYFYLLLFIMEVRDFREKIHESDTRVWSGIHQENLSRLRENAY